jgi:hypothetical protein
MRFVRTHYTIVTVLAAVTVVGLAGILPRADAMPMEVMSPAGIVTGSTVCLGPGFGAAPPAVVPSPLIVNPKGQVLAPPLSATAATIPGPLIVNSKGPLFAPPLPAPGAAIPGPLIVNPKGPLFTPPLPTPAAGVPRPALPPITLLSPTPATGSLVVPMAVPSVSGTGPSFTQMQLVIPGPNPAQNTAVSLSQLLSSTFASLQSSGVSTAPGVVPGSPSRLVSCF